MSRAATCDFLRWTLIAISGTRLVGAIYSGDFRSMLSDGWTKYGFVALAVLLVIALSGYSYRQYQEAQSQQALVERQANDQAQAQELEARQNADLRCEAETVTRSYNDCRYRAERDRQSFERQIRDLESQRVMALWTRYMGVASIIGTAVGAISIVLVFVTFNEARLGNSIARKSNELQLRAYVTLDHFVWKSEKRDFKMQIEWINRGQTPAYYADAYADWISLSHALPTDFEFPAPASRDEEGHTPVGPGQRIMGSCLTELHPDLLRQASKGLRHIYIWGRVDYQDSFGTKRYTETAAKLEPEELAPEGYVIRWVSISRHNHAT